MKTKKILVTGCLNCPYNHSDNVFSGEVCAHPLTVEKYIQQNNRTVSKKRNYFPEWCPLEDN